MAEAIGVSRQVYANYENEINFPYPKMLIKLADGFDVSIDYLVGRTDEYGIIKPNIDYTHSLEYELIRCFRALNLSHQNRVIGYANALIADSDTH